MTTAQTDTAKQVTPESMPRPTLDKILSLGFRVFMRSPADSWAYFTDGKRIGYIQHNRNRGYSLTTVHKPNQQTGTGFRMEDGLTLEALTRAALESAFAHAPDWAYSRDRQSVVKYASIEAFIAADKFNQGYKEVSK